jgi:DNA repair ATPase RecN
MKITSIRGTNFLVFKEVELKPESKLTLLVGKNKAGKSGIIKLIQTGLLGTTDTSVIKHGADKSEILIDLDGFQVQRTITKKGQRLKVTNAEGDIKANPQSFLNQLLGNFSFDPIAFVLMESKDRKKYLLELFTPKVTADMLPFIEPELLSRVDFNKDGLSILKELENVYYARRSEINKQVAQKKGAYQEMLPKDYDPTAPEVGTDNLKEQLQTIDGQLQEIDRAKRQKEANERIRASIGKKIDELKEIRAGINDAEIDTIQACACAIADTEARLQRLQDELALARKHHQDALLLKSVRDDTLKAIAEQEESLKEFPIPEIPDIQEIDKVRQRISEELQKADIVAKAREQYEKAQAVNEEYQETNAESERLSEILDKLRKELPAKILKDANIPIEGLSFEGDKVLIGETSMDNMSTSEQVGISLKIVRSLNKGAKLKLLCLDRAESLDDETMQEFVTQIKKDEFQYVVTYVQHGTEMPENGILVDNGEVKQPC